MDTGTREVTGEQEAPPQQDSVQVVELDPDPEQSVQTKSHQEVIEDETGVETRETTFLQKDYKEGDSGVGHKEEIHIASDKVLQAGGTVTGETSIKCEEFSSDTGFSKKDQHTTHSVKLVEEPGFKQHQDTSTDQVCSVTEEVEEDGTSKRRVVTATREKVIAVKKRTAKITTPDGEVIETELPDDIAAIVASGGTIPPEFLAGKTVVTSSSSSSKHFETRTTTTGGQPSIETRELSDANASQLVDEIFSSIEKEHPEFDLNSADKLQKIEGVKLEASVETPDKPSISVDVPGAIVVDGEEDADKETEGSPSKSKKIFSFFGRKEGKDKTLDKKKKDKKAKEPDSDHPDVIVAESLEGGDSEVVVNVTAPELNVAVDGDFGVDTKKKSASLPKDIDHLSPNKVKKRHKHRHKGRQKELIVGEVEEVTEEQRHSILVEGPTSIDGIPSESESYTSESSSDEEDKKKKKKSHTLPRFGVRFPHKDKELKVKVPKPAEGVSGEVDVVIDGKPAEVGDVELELTTPEPPTVSGEVQLEAATPEVDIEVDKGDLSGPDVSVKGGSLKRGIKNIKQSLSVGPRQEEVVFTGTEHFPEEAKRPRVKVEKDRSSETSSEAGSQRDKGKKKHHSLKGIFSIKGPKVPEGEIEISGPDTVLEIEKPSVEGDISVTVPDRDRTSEDSKSETSGKGSLGKKFKIKFPKGHIKHGKQDEVVLGQSIDVTEEQKHPVAVETKLDIDADRPDAGIDGEIEGGKSGGFKFPSVHLPDINFKRKQGEVVVGASDKVEEGDQAKVKVGVELPEGEVELEGSPKGGKKKFKLPGFHIKGRGPQGEIVQEGSVEIPEGQIDVEVEGSPKGGKKFKLPDFNLPDIHFKGRGPKGDIDAEGDASVELPEGEVELEGSPRQRKKFKLPGFHIKGRGPKVEVEGEGELPEGDIDIDGSPKEHKFKLPGFHIKGHHPQGEIIEGESVEVTEGYEGPEGSPSGKKFKLPGFHIKSSSPKVEVEGVADVELPEGEVDVDGSLKGGKKKFKLPGFHIKGRGPQGEIVQEGGVEIPEGQVDVEVKGSPKGGKKFKLPDFNLPDIHWKGRKPKGEVDVEGGADVELPEGEVEIEGSPKGGKKKFKLPGFHIKGRGPQGEIVQEGSVEIPEGQVDVEVEGSPKGGKKFKLPDFNLPDIHFKGRGPKGDVDVEGGADVELPEGEVEVEGGKKKFKLPGFHIKGRGPQGEIVQEGSVEIPEGQVDVEVEGSPKGGKKFKLPDFNLPDIHFKGRGPKGDVDVEGGADVELPEGEVEIEGDKKKFKLPGFHIKGRGPQGEIVEGGSVEIPEGQVDVEVEGSPKGGKKFKLPDFNLPDIHFKGRGPKGDVDVEGGADVDLPEGEVEVEGGKKKFKLPGFHIKGRGPQGEIVQEGSVEIPEGQVDVEVEGSPKGGKKFKLPDFNLPDIHFKGRGPKGDVDVEGGADVELPEGEVEIEGDRKKFKLPGFHIKGRGPQGEIVEGGSVEIPEGQIDVEVEGSPKGGKKFKLPDFNLPEIHFKGRGPKGDVDVEGGADVELPEGEVELEGSPKGDKKKFKLPGFHIKGRGPEGELKGEVPEGEVHLEGSPKEHKFKLPDFHIKGHGPQGEIVEGASVEVRESYEVPEGTVKERKKFKLPGFHFKGSGPKVEGEGASVPSGEVDIEASPKHKKKFKLPSFNFKGRGPKGDIEGGSVPSGEVSIEGSPKGGKKKFKLPGFNIRGRGPQGEIIQEGSVEIPEAQVDVEVEGSPKGGKKFKLPDFNLPDIHFKGRGPKGDVDVEGGADVELPEGEVEVEGEKKKFKLPGFHIKGRGPQGEIVQEGGVEISEGQADIEVEGSPKGGKKFKLPDFNLPDIHFKGRGPKGDVNVEGGADVELPEGEVEVEGGKKKFKLPGFHIKGRGPQGEIVQEGSVEIPEGQVDVELEGSPKGGKKFKLPDFNLPDIHFKGRGPKGDVDVEGGADIDLPEGEVEVEGSPKGGKKKFKLPGFHIKGRGPQGEIVQEGGVEISEGQADIEVEGSPKSGKKFKLPDFNLPDIHFKGRGPKGDVDVEGGADVELPEGEVEVEGGKKKFKLPGFHIKGRGTQGEVIQEGSVEIPEGQVDLEVEGSPKGGKKFKLPDFNLPDIHFKGRGPKGDVDVEGGADVELPEGEVEVEGGKKKFKLPGFHIKGRGPQGEIVQEGGVEISEGQADIEVEGSPKGGKKFKLPDFNLPDIHFKGRGPKGDVDVEGGADVELPEGEVEVEGGKKKFKLPGFHIKGRGTQGEVIQEGSVEIPEGQVDVEVEGSPKGGKKFKLPDFNLPDIHFKGRGPKGDVDVEGGADVELPEGEVEVEGEKKKFKLPGFHIKGRGPQGEIVQEGGVEISEGQADIEVEGSPKGGKKFKLPDFNLPDIHFKGRGPKGDVNVEGGADVELPEGEVEVERSPKGGKKKFKLPGFHIKGRGTQGEVIQEGSVEIPEGQVDIEVEGSPKGGKKFKLPDFNLPDVHFKGRGPKADIDVEGGADVEADSKGSGTLKDKTKFKLPSLHLKGSASPGEVIEVGTVEVREEREPSEADTESKGSGTLKLKKKFKLPSFGIKGSAQGEVVEAEGLEVKEGREPSEADSESKGSGTPKSKRKKFKLPGFHIKGSAPQGEIVEDTGAEVEEGKFSIEADSKGSGSPKSHKKKFKLPGFHIKGSATQGEVVEAEGVEVKESTEGPEGDRKKFRLPGIHLKGSATTPKAGGEIAVDESVEIKEHKPEVDIGGEIGVVNVELDQSAPEVKTRTTKTVKAPKVRLSFPSPKDQQEIIVGETTQIKEAHRQLELDEIPVEGEGEIEPQQFEILPEELQASAKVDHSGERKSHTFPRPHLPKVHLTLTRGDRERQSELVSGESEHVIEGKIEKAPPPAISFDDTRQETHLELEASPEGEIEGDLPTQDPHKTKHKFHFGGGFGFGGKKKDQDPSLDKEASEGASGEGTVELPEGEKSIEVQKTKKIFHIKGFKGKKKDRGSKGSSSGDATPSADIEISTPEGGGTLREVRKTKEIFHLSGKGPKDKVISVEGVAPGDISVEGGAGGDISLEGHTPEAITVEGTPGEISLGGETPKGISVEGNVPGVSLETDIQGPDVKIKEGGLSIHEVRTTKQVYHIGSGSGGKDKPELEHELSDKEKTSTGKKLRGLFHIDKKVKGPEVDVGVSTRDSDKDLNDKASDKTSTSSRSSSPAPGKSHKFSFGGIFGGKGKKRHWRKRSKKDSEGEAKAYPDEEPVPASKSVNIVGQEDEQIEFIPIEAKAGELQATPGSVSIDQNGQIERSVEFPGGTFDIGVGGVTSTGSATIENQKNIQNGLDKPSIEVEGDTPGFTFAGGGLTTDHIKEQISSTREVIIQQTSSTLQTSSTSHSIEMGGTTSTPKTEHSEQFRSGDGPHHDISTTSSHSTATYHVHGPVTPSTSQSSPAHTLSESFDAAVTTTFSHRSSVDSGTGSDPSRPPGHFVIVAIDFGTTYSGYAFSFTRDPEAIHMMRKWEGGDPGVINQKTPTSLLLTPQGEFHSFGFTARDFFHDLSPEESRQWLYFEKFKMTLHYSADLNKDTMLTASNGKEMPALSIFSHALRYFKEHSLQELTDQSSTKILNEDVRWVISVPAIWKAPAKQFMRQAAYNAGIASPDYPDQLLIALEPEAASIYCRKLRMHQLVPERPIALPLSPKRSSTPEPNAQERVSEGLSDDSHSQYSLLDDSNIPDIYYATPETPTLPRMSTSTAVTPIGPNTTTVGSELQLPGTRYMVVDCGGGTVDITVHEMESRHGNLKELYKASGGPFGSVGVDMEFEKLLIAIFGKEFINQFRYKRPAGYVDLMIAFESRKRAASPYKSNPLNVSLPFSFIDYYKKTKNSQVESAIRKYGNKDIRWSSQGMLRLMPSAMRLLFAPTLDKITQAIGEVLNNPAVRDISYLFLVGGFAESPMLQYEVRKEFGDLMRIIIPQDVGLTILKGAVCFGLDPAVVSIRRSRLTYGVGVLNRFNPDKHPKDKLVAKDGHEWCTDVFDRFVVTDQPIALGDTVLRSYTPAKLGQKASIINIYATEENKVRFITDAGVKKVGTLFLDLSDIQYAHSLPKRREIQTRMTFGDTEIKVSALDVATGKCVKAGIDFLNK